MLPLSRQNAYRARYQKLRPSWQPSGQVLEGLVRATLQPTSRVLDVGCGRGGVLELFWREVALGVGVDPDWRSLREHRARAAPAALPRVCAFGDALPFPAQTFDVVLGIWLLEHLAQPARVFAAVSRVLKPGGRFICLTPNAQHPLILANRFSWAFPLVQRVLVPSLYGRSERDTFRVHYRANTLPTLRTLATQAGLRVVSLRPISDPTYLAFNDFFFALSVAFEDLLPANWGVHLLGEFSK